MDTLIQDFRYALRQSIRRPAFTAIAVLSLALAIGGNSLIYGFLDGFVFHPFPYPYPDRLVSVGRITVPLVFETQTESIADRFYVQEWDTTPAPFRAMAAMA